MGCPDVETVQAYLAASLPDEERSAVEAHAQGCATCGELIAALAETRHGKHEARPAPAEAPGERIGRYVIDRRLGAGAMGVVYAAHDPELARGVALKLLKVDSEDRRARLVREAQALARISHPNVCAVYDIGTSDGRVFVAMELIDGATLGEWLAAERRGVAAILPVFVAAARGLAAAHAVGIVHRDFKPENVLVGRDGRVRVTDFGLAGWAAGEPQGSPDLEDGLRLTQTGSIVGTPLYLSPEGHAGRATDARSDQFSFFVALHEALYGERPFKGRTLSELAAAAAQGIGELPRRAGVPGWLERAVRRGLAVDPAARHPDMATVAELLAHRRRGRRAVLVAGAAALAAAAITVGVTGAGRAPAPSCGGAAARLAGVWDGARKAEARAAFARAGAEVTWGSVEARLDAYAARWASGVEAACKDTRIAGTQTEEMLALRLGCYDERLAGLRALAAAFAAAGGAAVEHAALAAERLDDLASCDNAAALGATLLPPKDAAAGVAAARAQSAAVKSLLLVAPWASTLAAAQAAVAAADATGWPPVMAEARVALTEVHLAARAYPKAEETAHEALRLAEEGRHDRARAEAAVLLSSALRSMKKNADAERWARVAEAVFARIGGDDDLAVRLDVERADLASLQRALATETRARGGDTVRAAEILYMIAMEHELHDRPGDAAAARARADAIFKTVRGAVGTEYAPLLSREMQALAAGDFEQAIAYGEAGVAAMARVHPPDHPLYAEAISALSYSYEAADRYEEALRLKRRAISILERAGEDKGLLATVLHDAGTVETRLGRHAEALADLERALALVEPTAAEDDPLPAMCRSGLGEALVGLGRAREALAPLERALAWREAHAAEIPAVQLGATRFALARARWAEGDRARALDGARAAREAFVAHRARFEGQPGWAKKAVKVAAGKIADVDRWLAERATR